MKPGELEEHISKLLGERGLIKDPEVLVHITRYGSKEVFILGQVDRPGQYAMSQPWSLMDAILIAGGLDFTAADSGYLHRRASEAEGAPPLLKMENPDMALPGTTVQKVDLKPLKTGGKLEDNIILRKGDVFIVPRRSVEMFYVIGDLRGPGAFEMPPGGSVTPRARRSRGPAGRPAQPR